MARTVAMTRRSLWIIGGGLLFMAAVFYQGWTGAFYDLGAALGL